ncbi:DNA-binding protein [Pseudomonas chlororaphis]|uniref:helix-turn-helix transcriptional regulator n=1 Tax=Pseudomonas chlororaphis TaxID=587753 RepID=UPI00209A7D78|nr:DNA-binding protein [Pseudomonas chlororaphis]MCO7572062.1 DNA-binding protein [Pseudomonas chlororaphis]MCO7590088.1 DNA-binding protein [Pseudomonas chlororaphis]
MEYLFTLNYLLPLEGCDPLQLVERLGAAGCTDVLVGTGLAGRLALEFSREAESAEAALLSALGDIKRIIPEARLVEASPDFVGLSEIAEIVGVSRQNMRKLMLGHADTFPLAIHEGSTSLWHLAEVLSWLDSKGGYPLKHPVIEVARVAQQVNTAKESKRIGPLSGELVALLG